MNARQVRWGLTIFTGLMVSSVGVALAGLTWRLAGYSGVGPVAVAGSANAGSAGSADLGPVLALAPFGTVLAAGDAQGDGSIRLKAIFLAIPHSASSVLIAGSDGKVASYAIGSAVGDGVIDQILSDQIVVRKAGGMQAIGFAAVGSNMAAVATAASVGVAPTRATAPGPGREKGGSDTIRTLMPVVGPDHIPSGSPLASTISGYRIDSSASPALISAGLRAGDVVEQINGTQVGAGLNTREVLAQAMQAGHALVVINRAGQRVALNLVLH